MPEYNIDIPLLFKLTFQLFRQYGSFIIGVAATFFVLGIVPNIYLLMNAPAEPTIESQLLSMVFLLLRLFLALGFTKVMLFLADDRPVDVKDMASNGSIFLGYAVGYFMFLIVVGIGLFLLILPGIYLAIRLQFFPYYVIEYGDTSFIALQKSWYATEEWLLELFLFGLCVVVINLLGALCFGIGLVLTYPLTTLATSIVFLGLDAEAESIPDARFGVSGD